MSTNQKNIQQQSQPNKLQYTTYYQVLLILGLIFSIISIIIGFIVTVIYVIALSVILKAINPDSNNPAKIIDSVLIAVFCYFAIVNFLILIFSIISLSKQTTRYLPALNILLWISIIPIPNWIIAILMLTGISSMRTAPIPPARLAKNNI